MDFNVDPCEDFYQFACGKILKATQKPDSFVNHLAVTDINEKRK